MNLEALKDYIKTQCPPSMQIVQSIIEHDSENSSAIFYKTPSYLIICFCLEDDNVMVAAQEIVQSEEEILTQYDFLLAELRKHIDISSTM